mgnify:CR=1 FL=1
MHFSKQGSECNNALCSHYCSTNFRCLSGFVRFRHLICIDYTFRSVNLAVLISYRWHICSYRRKFYIARLRKIAEASVPFYNTFTSRVELSIGLARGLSYVHRDNDGRSKTTVMSSMYIKAVLV